MEVKYVDWRKFVVEWGWVAIAVPLLALIGTTIVNIAQDNKGWKNIKNKIGEKRGHTLEEQHEDIKDAITEKTSTIYTKVEKISDITIRNESLYKNLDLNQQKVKDNVNKLVFDWEKTVTENKELNKELQKIKEQNNILIRQNNEMRIENKELKKEIGTVKEQNNNLIWQNNEIRIENKELQREIGAIKEQNNTLIRQSNEIKAENKKLSKQVELARRTLRNKNKETEYNEIIENENENDWDLEL